MEQNENKTGAGMGNTSEVMLISIDTWRIALSCQLLKLSYQKGLPVTLIILALPVSLSFHCYAYVYLNFIGASGKLLYFASAVLSQKAQGLVHNVN